MSFGGTFTLSLMVPSAFVLVVLIFQAAWCCFAPATRSTNIVYSVFMSVQDQYGGVFVEELDCCFNVCHLLLRDYAFSRC